MWISYQLHFHQHSWQIDDDDDDVDGSDDDDDDSDDGWRNLKHLFVTVVVSCIARSS